MIASQRGIPVLVLSTTGLPRRDGVLQTVVRWLQCVNNKHSEIQFPWFLSGILYIMFPYNRKMAFSQPSTLSKVGLGISFAAVLFDIAGFPTPYWLTKTFEVTGALKETNVGLFRACSWGRLCTVFSTSEYVAMGMSWLVAVQAFAILGFFSGVVGCAMILLHVATPPHRRSLKVISLFLTLAAVGITLTGIIIFGIKSKEEDMLVGYDLSGSFTLTLLSSMLYLAAGVDLAVDVVAG